MVVAAFFILQELFLGERIIPIEELFRGRNVWRKGGF
jgi:hypothetical protein